MLTIALNTKQDSNKFYFDPSDYSDDKDKEIWSFCHHFLDQILNYSKELAKSQPSQDNEATTRVKMKKDHYVNPIRKQVQDWDLYLLQPCLAWLPLDIVKKTLECTTQLAQWHSRLPMRRHWKARFPWLNVTRLSEAVATDTFFASIRALLGETCAQIFYGITSCMINIYGMRTESEGKLAYEDFIRDEGAPTILRKDNSKM